MLWALAGLGFEGEVLHATRVMTCCTQGPWANGRKQAYALLKHRFFVVVNQCCSMVGLLCSNMVLHLDGVRSSLLG